MLGKSLMVYQMVKEFLHGVKVNGQEINMLANFLMVKEQVKELIFMRMEINMLAN